MTKKPPRRKVRDNSHRGGVPADLAPIRWDEDLKAPFVPRSKPMPAPPVGIFDAPYTCVRINLQWLSHIMGVMETLNVDDAWSGDEDAVFDARQEIMKLYAAMAAANACIDLESSMLLRQNPTRPNLLEQSHDGGLTWTLAYDYAKYRPRTVMTTIEINTLITDSYNQFQDNRTTYNNNILNIAPNLNFGGAGVTDEVRNKALCMGVDLLIRVICDAGIANAEAEANGLNSTVEKIGIAGTTSAALLPVAGAVFGFAVAPIMILSVGVTGLFALLGAGTIPAGTALFEDEDAIEAVACCAYNAIKGIAPTQAQFSAMLDGCSFSPGNSESLRLFVKEFLTDLDIYLQFFKFVNELIEAQKAGATLTCKCEPTVISRLSGDGNDNISIRTAGGVARGVYSSSVDWYIGEFVEAGGVRDIRDIQVVLDLGAVYNVVSVDVDAYMISSVSSASEQPFVIQSKTVNDDNWSSANDLGSSRVTQAVTANTRYDYNPRLVFTTPVALRYLLVRVSGFLPGTSGTGGESNLTKIIVRYE